MLINITGSIKDTTNKRRNFHLVINFLYEFLNFYFTHRVYIKKFNLLLNFNY